MENDNLNDLPQISEDDELCQEIIGMAGLLVDLLEGKRSGSRLWAIAYTDAQKLLAWVRYVYDHQAEV